MGEGNFGGNGSVNWDITVERQGRFNPGNGGPGNRRKSDGTDDQFNPNFVVSVRPPDGKSAVDFLRELRDALRISRDGLRVEFDLPLEKDSEQIKVGW